VRWCIRDQCSCRGSISVACSVSQRQRSDTNPLPPAPYIRSYLNRSLAISEEIREAPAFLRSAAHLGRVHAAVGDFNAAIKTFEQMATVARATKNGAAYKEANDGLQSAKAAKQAGTKVSRVDAALALEQAIGKDAPQHKWTVKGTVSRMFGRKYKVRPGLGEIRAANGDTGGDEDRAAGSGPTTSTQSGVVLRRKPSVAGVRSRMKRLSSMFAKPNANRDQVYLPSSGRTPSDANREDDPDEYNIEFDELIFTLSQLEQQAKQRQGDDLRQLGNAVINPVFALPDHASTGGDSPAVLSAAESAAEPVSATCETSFMGGASPESSDRTDPTADETAFLDDIIPSTHASDMSSDNGGDGTYRDIAAHPCVPTNDGDENDGDTSSDNGGDGTYRDVAAHPRVPTHDVDENDGDDDEPRDGKGSDPLVAPTDQPTPLLESDPTPTRKDSPPLLKSAEEVLVLETATAHEEAVTEEAERERLALLLLQARAKKLEVDVNEENSCA
jgi:hypothetical protein